MAVVIPSTLNVRVLIVVGDGEPIELGVVDHPGVKARALPAGGPGAELVFSTRQWRRRMRRFFRAAARAF